MSTLTHDEIRAALRTLVANGLTFGECAQLFGPADGDEKLYAEAAGRIHNDDGECEVDGNPVVSPSEDGGAYVMAWVWVSDKDIWQGPTDSDGEPCRVLNHYTCEECNESWLDQWSCECNDKCPKCDREIEPERSDYLDLAGNVIPEEDTQESSSA